MIMTTTTTEPLWWSASGNLRCRAHLPLPGSESWWQDGWATMAIEDRERLARIAGKPATCEICAEHATGAHAAYLVARTAVADAITALVTRLDDLDEREDIAQSDWGFSGTLLHVAAALRELALSPKGGA